MNLNLGSILFSSANTNTFHSEYRDNIKIAEAYKYTLKPMLINKSKGIGKNFHPRRVLYKEGGILVGDEGGNVLSISDNSICDVLYQHNMKINAMILSENKKMLITGGDCKVIKIYQFLKGKPQNFTFNPRDSNKITEEEDIKNSNVNEKNDNFETNPRRDSENLDEDIKETKNNLEDFSKKNNFGTELKTNKDIKEENEVPKQVSIKTIGQSLKNIFNSKPVEKPLTIEYEFDEELYEIEGQDEIILSLCLDESKKILYSSSPSGKIYIFDINRKKLIKTLKLEKNVPIISLKLNKDKNILFAGTANNKILLINTEKNKKIKEYKCTSKSITTIDLNEDKLYAGTNEGLVEVFNIEKHKKINNLKMTDCEITSLFLHGNKNLFYLDTKGSICEYSLETGYRNHLREEIKKGNQYCALNDFDQLYVVGTKDCIEKWDLKRKKLVNHIFRNETPTKNNYQFFHYDTNAKKYIIFTEEGNMISYKIGNSLETTNVLNRVKITFPSEIRNMGISRDKNYYVFVCEDLKLRIWDVRQSKFVATLEGHKEIPVSFWFTNSDKYLYTTEKTGLTIMWDLHKRKLHMNIRDIYRSEVLGTFMTNNERCLYILRKRGNLQVFDLKVKRVIYDKIINDEDITTYYFDERLQAVFTADIGGMIVRSDIEGEKKIVAKELIDKDLIISSIFVNKTGTKMAFSTEKRKLYIYDLEKRFGFGSVGKMMFDIREVFFSEDSEAIFCIGELGTIYGWNLENKTQMKTFESIEKMSISAIAMNKTRIFAATRNELIVYNLLNKNLEHKIKLTDGYNFAYCLAMNGSGNLLYSGHADGKVLIWSPDTFEKIDEIIFHTQLIANISVSITDKTIVTYSPDVLIVLYDTTNDVSTKIKPKWEMKSVKISDNDELILAEMTTGQVNILDREGQIIGIVGKKTNFLRGFNLSNDGNFIYLMYRDSSVQIWDVQKSEPINNFPRMRYSINYAVKSESGNKLFMVGNREELNILNSKTGKLIKKIALPYVTKIKFLTRFKDNLCFVYDRKIMFIKINSNNVSFYETEYIIHSFLGYDHNNAEKEFLNNLEYIKQKYDSSYILPTFFNPILVCALFNYQNAIQTIFKKKYCLYPILNDKNQISPLILALKLGHLNIAQIILKELSKNPENVYFSKREMIELLNSKYEFTHKYLLYFMINIKKFTNTTIHLPTLSKLDEPIRIDYDFKPNFTPEKYEDLSKPKIQYNVNSHEDKVEKILKRLKSNVPEELNEVKSLSSKFSGFTKSETSMLNKSEISKKKIKDKKKTKALWRPTQFFRINGFYSFEEGSVESVNFLENYYKSQNHEFILSNWRYIIDYKWQKVYAYLVPQACLNWTHSLFFSLFLIYPEFIYFYFVDGGLLLLSIIYEMLSLFISGPKAYFRNTYNIVDATSVFLCIVVLFCTYFWENDGETSPVAIKYLQVFSLVLVYYRAITYLRIFKAFRNVIDMVISVTVSSLSLLMLFCFFLVFFTVMFMKASDQKIAFGKFILINFYSIHGELEGPDGFNGMISGNEDNYTVLSWCIFVVMAIFVPLIMVNFLIAKMSNKYTELEEIEEVTAYREKAKLIVEIEYFYKMTKFKKKKKGKIEKIKSGFTFIAKDSSHVHQNEHLSEERDEDNLTNFQDKIKDLHRLVRKEITTSVSRHEEFRNNMNKLKDEFDFIKEEVDTIKNENTLMKNNLNIKINNLDSNLKDLLNKFNVQLDKESSNRINKKGFWG